MTKIKLTLSLIAIGLLTMTACRDSKVTTAPFTQIASNQGEKGTELEITFFKGKTHNYPTFAFWIEDLEGNFIETLYVTQYLGTGIYGHGALGVGKWDNKPGEAERPSALPYWIHKRAKNTGKPELPTAKNPVPDAITAPTPTGNFVLKAIASKAIPEKFRLVMEINQPWDWNEFWHNNKFPEDFNYAVSCQPALVYAVTIDQSNKETDYFLNPIGHSHYSGLSGTLYTDLSTHTTAKDIVHKVYARIK